MEGGGKWCTECTLLKEAGDIEGELGGWVIFEAVLGAWVIWGLCRY